MNTKEQLEQINDAICDAEWHRDKDKFLERILSKDLVFRRASGDIVDKGTYLNGLADKNNTYTHLENLAVTIGFNNEENIAIAIVIVKSAGTRGAEQQPFSGVFRNVRFFCKNTRWELFLWFNEKSDNENKDIDNFLVKDYELKIGYLKDQLDRMWTRFNIFVTIESALFGGKFLYFDDSDDLPFALLGTLLSITWYIFGANDKYLVEMYRTAIKEAAQKLKTSFPAQHIYSVFNYNYVGDVYAEFEYKLKNEIEVSPLSWRIKFLSITPSCCVNSIIACRNLIILPCLLLGIKKERTKRGKTFLVKDLSFSA